MASTDCVTLMQTEKSKAALLQLPVAEGSLFPKIRVCFWMNLIPESIARGQKEVTFRVATVTVQIAGIMSLCLRLPGQRFERVNNRKKPFLARFGYTICSSES